VKFTDEFTLGLTREQVEKMALAAEKYHRSATNTVRMGGLHDYIGSLSDADLVNVLQKFMDEHVELRQPYALSKLSFPEFFQDSKPMVTGTPLIGGGIADFLASSSWNDLKTTALNCEDFYRKKNNIVLMGGLHDYVNSLSKEALIGIITDYTKKCPELNSSSALKALNH